MDWVWFLCRRTVRYILIYTTNVIIKLKAKLTVPTRSRVLYHQHHNIIKETNTNTLYIHMPITTITTRLWVTSPWYLRWRWTKENVKDTVSDTSRTKIFKFGEYGQKLRKLVTVQFVHDFRYFRQIFLQANFSQALLRITTIVPSFIQRWSKQWLDLGRRLRPVLR